MPQINKLGYSRHRFQLGQGLYTAGDVERGTVPTPSQSRRGITDAKIEQQWFRLTLAQKQLWQDAANELIWADFGSDPRPPSGRQLYNRLNRSRHYYTLSTGGSGTHGGLATVAEPPGAPQQQPEITGFTVKAQASQLTSSSVLTYEWVQQGIVSFTQPTQIVNPAQRSFGHPCPVTDADYFQSWPGVNVTYSTDPTYWPTREYGNLDASGNTFMLYRAFTTNDIPHYFYNAGSLQIGYNAIAANVFVELLWDQTNRSTDGPLKRWLTQGAIAEGLQAQGGQAMPYLFADQPDAWAIDLFWPKTTPNPDDGIPQFQAPPNDGLQDLKYNGPWFPQPGCDGAPIRMRVWPFDANGWPGSKIEAQSTILVAPTYATPPTCP